MLESITILVVEDEPDIREMVAIALDTRGATVLEAADTQEAWRSLSDHSVDLILLDWMLPDVSGVELLRRVRRDESRSELPVIMLTARGREEDRVRGLDQGADDYLVKPFSIKELVSRTNALLRRTSPLHGSRSLNHNGLELDLKSLRVTAEEQEIELAPTEFKLLRFFMENPDRVFSRSQLLDRVWGSNVFVEERTVDVHIRRLRKALEPSDHHGMIQTVRGMGYRFSP